MSNLTDNTLKNSERAENFVEALISSFSDLQNDESQEKFFPLNEIPLYKADPNARLPGNLESIEKLIEGGLKEIHHLIDEELKEVSSYILKAETEEEKVRRNALLIQANLREIQKNTAEIIHQGKSRDYWLERERGVLADYQQIEGSQRETDWAWLIRKYGLKESNGVLIDYRDSRVAELCRHSANELMAEYREASYRHERSQKGKEVEISLLENTNHELSQANKELGIYISNLRQYEIKPLQDGVLLYRELLLKMKELKSQERPATYIDIRSWAESYLDQYLRNHPFIPFRVVGAFRKFASIPLPTQNS